MTRAAFAALGGFAAIPLMEDIDFCRRAKALSRPAVPARARASPRAGAGSATACWRTILLMWRLRLAYWLGADPAELARRYRAAR